MVYINSQYNKMIYKLSNIQKSILFGPIITGGMLAVGWTVGNMKEVNDMSFSLGIFLGAFFILICSLYESMKYLYLAIGDKSIKEWSSAIWLMLLFVVTIVVYTAFYTYAKSI